MQKSIDGKHGSSKARVDQRVYGVPLLADISRLVIAYCVWKIILAAAVAFSPGPGYDTSTQLLFEQDRSSIPRGFARFLVDFGLRLTRWDGIYFAVLSQHGHVHEQQWAFSWVLTRFTARLADVIPLPQSLPHIVKHVFSGILVSLISHLGAVILLYLLVDALLPADHARRRRIALTTAYLHIVSPAGVFLLAPSAEAPFALVNLAGSLSYAYAILSRTKSEAAHEAIWMVAAGTLFGLSAMLRGNGVLSGLIFAWDMLKPSFDIVLGARTLINFRRLFTAGVAGLLVGIGFALPQYIAYREYCNATLQRPWCSKMPPSIYSWVQEQYWNVGLFRYWTLGNIPLFVMAAPMIFLLLNTGYACIHHSRSLLIAVNGEDRPAKVRLTAYQAQRLAYRHILERLALPQMLLAIMALTNFHVQIINRISSAYPVWYLVLAVALHDESPLLECGHARSEHYYSFRLLHGKTLQRIIQGLVIYSVLQAGLYSAFLPPA